MLVNEFGVLKLCNFEHATRIPQNCLSLLTPAKEFAAQLLTKPAVYMAPELLHVLPAKDGSNRYGLLFKHLSAKFCLFSVVYFLGTGEVCYQEFTALHQICGRSGAFYSNYTLAKSLFPLNHPRQWSAIARACWHRFLRMIHSQQVCQESLNPNSSSFALCDCDQWSPC